MIINIIGVSAAICRITSFVPQAIKVYNTKNTDGISLWMYIIFIVGNILWLIYGILIKAYEIVFSNFITIILAIYILYYVILNEKRRIK
tara:strand:- start:737 stop:1003 length:267 start_codon:yes stop_codon:yes gene_type:complete